MVFVYDESDYDEEIEKVRAAARYSAKRIDFRVGLCTDKKLIKKYKKETNWFPGSSMSAIVLKRYDGEYISIDLMDSVVAEALTTWFLRKSLKNLEQLSDELFFIQNLIGQPVLVAFVDLKGIDQ